MMIVSDCFITMMINILFWYDHIDNIISYGNMIITAMAIKDDLVQTKAVCGGGKVSVPALEDLLLKARQHDFSQPHNYELFSL